MLRIGKVPYLLNTREIEDALLNGIASQEQGEESWIITPYSTMDKLGTIRRAITEACKRDVQMRFVVRDESEQVKSAVNGLKESLELGLEIFGCQTMDRTQILLFLPQPGMGELAYQGMKAVAGAVKLDQRTLHQHIQ